MLPNIKLLLEYDGTAYYGWQWQRNLASVEGELRAALQRLLGEPVPTLLVAGRTDAGVHAVGQVVNFRLLKPTRITPRNFAYALNAVLPPTISVHESVEVPYEFNARLDACSKIYRYRIYQGPFRPALARTRAWHLRKALDLEAMRLASQALLGEQDFESFRSAHCDAPHARRNMQAISFLLTPREPLGNYLDISLQADAFCRHMCRIIVGTLVEIGWHKRSSSAMLQILHQRDRQAAGVTAPPEGLTLMQVIYGARGELRGA